MIVLEVKTYAKPKQFKAVDEAIGICQFLRNKSIRLGSDKVLPAKVSQQILMILDKNWKSFFEAVKAYKIDSSKIRYVAGAMGPTTKLASMSPIVSDPGYRAVSFDQLVDAYTEQS